MLRHAVWLPTLEHLVRRQPLGLRGQPLRLLKRTKALLVWRYPLHMLLLLLLWHWRRVSHAGS